MKKLQKLTAVLLSVAMIFAMTACGSESTNEESGSNSDGSSKNSTLQVQEPVTIEFWHTLGGDAETAMQEMIAEFNKSNEYGITVNGTYQGAYERNLSKVIASYGTTTAPTMALLASGGFEQLYDAGALADLAPYIERDNWDLENIPENLRHYMSCKEGEVIEFPYLVSTAVLYYNKALMSTEPTTLEELVSSAKSITSKDSSVYGMFLSLDEGFIQRPIIKTLSGTDFTTDDGNAPACLDDGSLLQFLKDWKSWTDEGFCMKLTTTDIKNKMFNAFSTGKLASFVTSTAQMDEIQDLAEEAGIELGVAKMVGYGGYAAPIGGGGLVVLDSATQQEQAAAWEFIKFLYEDSNVIKMHKASSYIPFTYSSMQNQETIAYWDEHPGFKIATEQLEWGTYNGWSLYLSEWRTQIKNCMTSVLIDGSMTPEEAIDYLRKQAVVIFP